MSVLTIRDVPDAVKDALMQQARRRGQSLQAFVLGTLERQAAYSRNQRLLSEIERELAVDGGADEQTPSAADVLADARGERERAGDGPATQGADGAA